MDCWFGGASDWTNQVKSGGDTEEESGAAIPSFLGSLPLSRRPTGDTDRSGERETDLETDLVTGRRA